MAYLTKLKGPKGKIVAKIDPFLTQQWPPDPTLGQKWPPWMFSKTFIPPFPETTQGKRTLDCMGLGGKPPSFFLKTRPLGKKGNGFKGALFFLESGLKKPLGKIFRATLEGEKFFLKTFFGVSGNHLSPPLKKLSKPLFSLLIRQDYAPFNCQFWLTPQSSYPFLGVSVWGVDGFGAPL